MRIPMPNNLKVSPYPTTRTARLGGKVGNSPLQCWSAIHLHSMCARDAAHGAVMKAWLCIATLLLGFASLSGSSSTMCSWLLRGHSTNLLGAMHGMGGLNSPCHCYVCVTGCLSHHVMLRDLWVSVAVQMPQRCRAVCAILTSFTRRIRCSTIHWCKLLFWCQLCTLWVTCHFLPSAAKLTTALWLAILER